jgi:hypothetical protein
MTRSPWAILSRLLLRLRQSEMLRRYSPRFVLVVAEYCKIKLSSDNCFVLVVAEYCKIKLSSDNYKETEEVQEKKLLQLRRNRRKLVPDGE